MPPDPGTHGSDEQHSQNDRPPYENRDIEVNTWFNLGSLRESERCDSGRQRDEGCSHQCAYTGHDRDNAGYTANAEEIYRPLPDEPSKLTRHHRFGGPHAAGLNMAFCDGAVDMISFDIDDAIWKAYRGRDDAEVR